MSTRVSYPPAPLLETLEGRRLLSVSVGPLLADLLDAPVPAHHAAPLAAVAKAAIPKLVGTWKGKITAGGQAGNILLKITSQASGHLRGTLSLEGSKPTAFNVPVTYGRNNSFSCSASKGTSAGKMSGQLSANGKKMTGKIVGKYEGTPMTATFALTRQ